jgi:hypothetical protein
MLSVNRCVAQAVLVALNAQDINTATASTHARNVADAAKAVATQLRNLIQGAGSPLPGQFTQVAHSNNTKMFQGNKVQLTGLQSTFMRAGLSTNVFFTGPLEAAVPVSLPSNVKSNFHYPNALKKQGNDQYMAGYINFAIPAGSGTTVNIAGIPIFPKQKPHLVDIGEFNGAVANAGGNGGPFNGGDYLPPNAFRADTRTLEQNSSTFGGAVACALVGTVSEEFDFVASIPRGYVRIKNGPDATSANSGIVSNPVVDSQTDVFNNELWPPSSAAVTNNNVYALASDAGYVNDWAAYNAQDQADNGALDGSYNNPYTGTGPQQPPLPNTAGAPADASDDPNSVGFGVITGTGTRDATEADVRGITNVTNGCDWETVWSNPGCGGSTPGANPPDTEVSNLARAMSDDKLQNPPTNPPTSNGYTAVEVQKHDLLSRRYGGGRCSSVVPVGQSGMKRFDPTGCYATSSSQVTFGAPGSPLQYIQQIGVGAGCANTIIDKIWDRMRQVDPSISRTTVETALASQPLELGETLYLYSPGPGQCLMQGGTPADYFNSTIQADGASSSSVSNCEHTYNIANTIVNANQGRGTNNFPDRPNTCGGHGDANFHQAPYTSGSTYIPAADRAIWTPASGWRNLLGDIQFQNEANGAGTFCKPN